MAAPDGAGIAMLAARIRQAGYHCALVNDRSSDWLALAAASDALLLVVSRGSEAEAVLQRFGAPARAIGIRHLIIADEEDSDEPALGRYVPAIKAFASRLELASVEIVQTGKGNYDELLRCLDTIAQEIASAPGQRTETVRTQQFAAHLVCIGSEPVFPGREYSISIAGQETVATLTTIKYRLDAATLAREPLRKLAQGEIGACTLATLEPIALDDRASAHAAGRFVLTDRRTGAIAASGTVDFALRRGTNLHLQRLSVDKNVRANLKGQRPCIVWLTGLSGAGKSTIANLVEAELSRLGCHTYLLDGDNIRHGLNKDLGFTPGDRVENIRRVGEVAKLFVDAGLIVICSFISPFRAERAAIRNMVADGEFIEIHVHAPLSVCEQRDPKGLYAKSRAGHLPNFTGIDSPYEAPDYADLVLDTAAVDASTLAATIVELLRSRQHIPRA